VASGSSISHYDTVAFRNLLMEPAINADLTHRLKAPDTHGEVVSGVAHLTNEWRAAGLITGRQKGAVENAAARTTF
jgi:hypothetical protein